MYKSKETNKELMKKLGETLIWCGVTVLGGYKLVAKSFELGAMSAFSVMNDKKYKKRVSYRDHYKEEA